MSEVRNGVDNPWNQEKAPADCQSSGRRIVRRSEQNADESTRHQSAKHGQDNPFKTT